MSQKRQAAQQQDVAPEPTQSTPSYIGPGTGPGQAEYHFVVGLSEIQRTLGELTTKVDMVTKTVDSTKSKVEDLMAIKNQVTGAMWMLGIFGTIGLAILAFLAKVGYDIAMKPAPPVAQPPVVAQPERAPARPRAKSLPPASAPASATTDTQP